MKTFVYKTLFIFVCLFILYHLTVGPKLIELESRLENLKSRKTVESLKDKIKVQQPLIEELDIATFKPTEYQEGNTIQLTTYKYNDMLPHFSKQLII